MDDLKKDLALTKNQQEAITHMGDNILVSACAGSGKTFVLVQRVLNMLTRKDDPVTIDEICVVTFTNAAAREMKNKIKKTILDRISELDARQSLNDEEQDEYKKLKNAAFRIDFSHISTLHGFCKNLIEDNYKELNLNPNFSEITGYDREKLINNVLGAIFEEEYENEDFRSFVASYCNKYSNEIIKNIVKAYYEFLTTIPDKKEWFDCLCGLIDDERYKDSLDKIISIVTTSSGDDDMPYKKTSSESEGSFKIYGQDVKIRYDKKTLKGIYKLFKNHVDILNRLVIKFDDAYSKEKRRKNVLDFSDLERYALELLYIKKDSYITKEISNLGLELAGSFRQIFVDEYQDINSVQEEIIRAISNNYQSNNLFLVGDVKQSIYLFRHARCEIFMEKYNKYSAGDGGYLIKMNDNFRCIESVIDSVNKLYSKIMNKDYGDIEYDENHALVCTRYEKDKKKNIDTKTEFLNIYFDSKKVKEYDAEHKNNKSAKLNYNEPYYWKGRSYDKTNIYAEGLMIGKRIIELINESKEGNSKSRVKFSDIAILVQTADNGMEYKKALDELHIPSQIGDSNDDFFLSVEIRLMGDILKVISNPREDISLMAVLRSEIIGLSDEEVLKISTFAGNDFYDKKNNGVEKLIKSKEKETNAAIRSITGSIDFTNFVNSEENINLYDKLVYFKQNNKQNESESEILKKIDLFFEIFETLRNKSKYLSIDELIKEIYKKTSLPVIASGWDYGTKAVNNLESLVSFAQALRSNAHNSLFEFIQVFEDVYVNENKNNNGKKNTDNKVANFDVINPNCVKIITIHSSKGLEYPIVFVTNINKAFNEREFNKSKENNFAFDLDCGISFNPIDEKKNQYLMLKKLYATCDAKRKHRAEKLRLFYVALTRAKDKLILTSSRGVPIGDAKTKMASKKNKNSLETLEQNEIVSPNFLKNEITDITCATSFINYLEYVLTIEKKDSSEKIEDSVLSKKYSIYDKYEDIVSLYDWVKSYIGSTQIVSTSPNFNELNVSIDETKVNIENVYPYIASTITKPKVSVSDVAKKHFAYFSDLEEENLENDDKQGSDDITIEIVEQTNDKDFSSGVEEAILKGNSYHRFMQIFDYTSLDNNKLDENQLLNEIENQKASFVNSKLLDSKEASFVENEKIYAFLTSELGKKFIASSRAGNLFREQPFMKLLTKKEILEFSAQKDDLLEKCDDETQIVQGVIDAFYIEGNSFSVIDYKTDAVAKYGYSKGEAALIERYKNQLELYARALTEILGISCKEKYIYSFDLSKLIEIK